MAYVDGFVLAVPKKNLAAYKKMAMNGRQGLDGARRARVQASASPTTSRSAS